MSLKITGMSSVLKKLGSLAEVGKALKPTTRLVGKETKAWFKESPPSPSNRPYMFRGTSQPGASPFVTNKQRRWFFANLKSGNLSLPYRRTGGLSRGWRFKMTRGGLSVTIFNDVPNAGLMQGDEETQQTLFHSFSDWHTTTKFNLERIPIIIKMYESAMVVILNE